MTSIPSEPPIVLVTGASRGVGAAIARVFAEKGASLVITELPEHIDRATNVAESLKSEFQVSAVGLELDVRSQDSIESCVKKVTKEYERIDVLVNNAGTNFLVPSLQVTREQWDLVVDVNLKGTFFISQAVARQMTAQHSGCIVNIASQHGVVGNDYRAAYSSSKAGVINLTRALASEWARYGIRVNAVSPTFIITDENRGVLEDPTFCRVNLSRIPLRRYAKPDDVAYAVAYLASHEAGMVTGANLVVDGGWTAI